MASKAGCASVGERAITRSTSDVAVCCSNASLSSRVSRATSVSWPEADELLSRTAFGAFALRLRALVGLLLALERRRIAHPRLRTTPIFKEILQQGFAAGEMGFNNQFALPELDYDRSYSNVLAGNLTIQASTRTNGAVLASNIRNYAPCSEPQSHLKSQTAL